LQFFMPASRATSTTFKTLSSELLSVLCMQWYAVAQLVRHTAVDEIAGSIPHGVTGICIDLTLRSPYGPAVDSASDMSTTIISWAVKTAGV